MIVNVREHVSTACFIVVAENGVTGCTPVAHYGVQVYLLQFTVRPCLAGFILALMHVNSFLGCGEIAVFRD